MDGNASRVIGTAALITVGVGSLNSLYKNKKPPSMRFLIGSGAAFVILSAIGEGEPEVAKALAVAMAATVVIGDGGGVLSYMNGHGELDTKKPNPQTADDNSPLFSSADLYEGQEGPFTPDPSSNSDYDGKYGYDSSVVAVRTTTYRPDTITLIPGL